MKFTASTETDKYLFTWEDETLLSRPNDFLEVHRQSHYHLRASRSTSFIYTDQMSTMDIDNGGRGCIGQFFEISRCEHVIRIEPRSVQNEGEDIARNLEDQAPRPTINALPARWHIMSPRARRLAFSANHFGAEHAHWKDAIDRMGSTLGSATSFQERLRYAEGMANLYGQAWDALQQVERLFSAQTELLEEWMEDLKVVRTGEPLRLRLAKRQKREPDTK